MKSGACRVGNNTHVDTKEHHVCMRIDNCHGAIATDTADDCAFHNILLTTV